MSSKYTLGQYYREAHIPDIPEWTYGVKMRVDPWPHQIEDLRFCFQHERFGLFNDAGTGKTLPMQAMLILYCTGYGNKGVVCMPPSLIGQFFEAFFHPEESYYLNLKEFVNFKAYSGTKKAKNDLWGKWTITGFPELVVMSYQAFSNMHPLKPVKEKIIKNATTGKSWTRPAVKPLKKHPLKEFEINVLFFDEAQMLKNVSSGFHKKVFRYIGNTDGDFLLGLFTGSPIANTYLDAYGMIHLITPEIYPTKRSFEREHLVYAKDSDYPTVIGYKNQEQLHENLYLHARRVTKQEVLKDLPPYIPEAIPVELSQTHRRWYKKLLTERVLDLPGEYIDATQAQKLRQVALQMISMPERYIPVKVENMLFETLDTKICAINPAQAGNKVIIFAYYTATVEFLAEKYKDYNPAIINGSSGDKTAARRKFVDDDSCRIFIINWLSGGAGLNLQISCYTFFYEQPTVPSDAVQAISRSHRGGQDRTVNVTFFKVRGTLMAKSLKQLLIKDMAINEVVKDKHKMLHELLGE